MIYIQPTGISGVHLIDIGEQSNLTASYILEGKYPTIIETGYPSSIPRILKTLEQLEIDANAVSYIFPTHIHPGHFGGASALLEACPRAKIIVYKSGIESVTNPSWLRQRIRLMFGKIPKPSMTLKAIAKERTLPVSGGEVFPIDENVTLEVIHAPGHVNHQYCVFIPQHRALFVADACGIYRSEVGRLQVETPPPSFQLGKSLETLERLQELNPNTLLFTHFGVHKQPQLLSEYATLLAKWVTDVETAMETMEDEQAVIHHFIKKLTHARSKQDVERNVRGVIQYLKHR